MIKLNQAGLPKLLDLVPPLDRLNDKQLSNDELATLLAVLQSQSDALGVNINLLYESWFIETCDDWTVPYIAKLIGLPSDLADAQHIARQRALVANTIIYRSLRGTAHALSCAVQDASGWPVISIEGIERQFTTAQANLPPTEQPSIFNDTDGNIPAPPPNVLNTDRTTYSIFETPIAPPTSSDAVAIYYWRDQIVERSTVEAKHSGSGLFHFDPIGRSLPLMVPYWGQGSPATDLPMPLPIPVALTRTKLSNILQNASAKLDSHLEIFVDGKAVPQSNVFAVTLDENISKKRERAFLKGKAGTVALVDPERGAVKILPIPNDQASTLPKVHSNHWSTQTAKIGGGIYDRSSRMVSADATTWSILISNTKDKTVPDGFNAVFSNLEDAIQSWKNQKHTETIIHLVDNNQHHLSKRSTISLNHKQVLAIQAAQGFQPTISGTINVNGAGGSEMWISGCYVGSPVSVAGNISATFVDCTIWVDNSPAIHHLPTSKKSDDKTEHTRINLDHCITGPLQLSGRTSSLSTSDCIIDGMGNAALEGTREDVTKPANFVTDRPIGAAIQVEATTFLGNVYTLQVRRTLDTLLVGKLLTPRRTQVTASDGIWISKDHQREVEILSRISGMPGYAALSFDNPVELLEGGSQGSEFGAYHHRFNAARYKAALKVIQDYCPIGMTASVIDAGLKPFKR